MTKLEDHPYACIFPLLDDDELAELAADIRQNGLLDPVILYQGKILDGRNRYRALQSIDPEAQFATQDFQVPASHPPEEVDAIALQYVLSKNLHRRHLNTSQRAMIAARIATLKRGEHPNRDADSNPPYGGSQPATPTDMTRQEAAEKLKVAPRTVDRAKVVQAHGVPELVEAVEKGSLTVATAAEIATMPAEQQRDILSHGVGVAPAKSANPQSEKTGERDPRNPAPDSRFMPNADAAIEISRQFVNWIARLVAVKKDVRKAFPECKGVLAERIEATAVLANLDELIDAFRHNVPDHVCPACCGTGVDDKGKSCRYCSGYGMIDKAHWQGLESRWELTWNRYLKLIREADQAVSQ